MTDSSGRPPLTASNAKVKAARKLSRRPARAGRRLFLADGPNAVEAALRVPGRVAEVFVTPAADPGLSVMRDAARAQGVPWTPVDERAMAGLSEAVTPSGVVATCRFLDVPAESMTEDADLLVVAAEVRDPGNAGTVIRTADAAGADGVVLAGSSVDPYNAKTIRASAGSLFHLPLAIAEDAAETVRLVQRAGLLVLATEVGGELDLFDADPVLQQPVAWLFGNEARGLPPELAALADHRVSIPIAGHAESLNLATAAAVCLYATARARRG